MNTLTPQSSPAPDRIAMPSAESEKDIYWGAAKAYQSGNHDTAIEEFTRIIERPEAEYVDLALCHRAAENYATGLATQALQNHERVLSASDRAAGPKRTAQANPEALRVAIGHQQQSTPAMKLLGKMPSVCDGGNEQLFPHETYAISRRGRVSPSPLSDIFHFRSRRCAAEILGSSPEILQKCHQIALQWLRTEGRRLWGEEPPNHPVRHGAPQGTTADSTAKKQKGQKNMQNEPSASQCSECGKTCGRPPSPSDDLDGRATQRLMDSAGRCPKCHKVFCGACGVRHGHRCPVCSEDLLVVDDREDDIARRVSPSGTYRDERGDSQCPGSIVADKLGLPVNYDEELGSGVKLSMVFVPPGQFYMGSPMDEKSRQPDECYHLVHISSPFYIGRYPITQAQYRVILSRSPSAFGGDNHPVDSVSWEDCCRFIVSVNERLKKPEDECFSLPTEAQWEYACRAGTQTAFYFGDLKSGGPPLMLSHVRKFALVDRDPLLEKDGTKSVGQHQPNQFGLYDMTGNVWEWCSDWYGEYQNALCIDPTGPPRGVRRVNRGGSWITGGLHYRSASRGNRQCGGYDDVGFRVVRRIGN